MRQEVLNDLGLPPPAPTLLTTLVAFDIDVSSKESALPLQLAIKINPVLNPQTGQVETLAAGHGGDVLEKRRYFR